MNTYKYIHLMLMRHSSIMFSQKLVYTVVVVREVHLNMKHTNSYSHTHTYIYWPFVYLLPFMWGIVWRWWLWWCTRPVTVILLAHGSLWSLQMAAFFQGSHLWSFNKCVRRKGWCVWRRGSLKPLARSCCDPRTFSPGAQCGPPPMTIALAHHVPMFCRGNLSG